MDTRPTLITGGLTFTKYGYFVRRLSSQDPDLRRVSNAQEWLRLEELLDALKAGEFHTSTEVLELARSTRDWILKSIAIKILGHCATVSVYKEMRTEIEGLVPGASGKYHDTDVELTVRYCVAFSAWGRADVIPVILDRYLRLRQHGAAEISHLPISMGLLMHEDLGTMVSSEPPEDMLDEYLTVVLHEYETLIDRLGSESLIVYGGKVRSIRQLAASLIDPAPRFMNNTFRGLREMFEPATGIDCSAMFVDGQGAQPQAGALLGQAFLESPRASDFAPGQRYFFGHPVLE